MSPDRRTSDTLRAVDGLLHSQLQGTALDGRALANLAVAMATEYSDARRGTLLLDEGRGLEPVLALGPELTEAPRDRTAYDLELVQQARRCQATVRRGGRLAVPVLLQGRVHGILYLESEQEFSDDSRQLAESVAGRIANVLHSAELVDQLSRRTRNLELLEAISGCLSAGQLGTRHLEQTVDAALRATASDEAALALIAAGGELTQLVSRGGDRQALRVEARQLARRLAEAGEVSSPELAHRPTLLAPLARPQGLAGESDEDPQTIGFLLVRRNREHPYDEADRTFFRALAQLVMGALERRDYYRRAAEDPVTGTGSRLALQLTLSQLQAEADRSGAPFSVVVMDVDNFKEINDRHGHLEGDRVLRSLAQILRSRLRDQDFVARYGGDEFVALLPATDARGATDVAQELRRRVRGETETPDGTEISISVGVATYPAHASKLSELLDLGDRALYASKDAGRDRVTVATDPPAPVGTPPA